MTTPGRHANKRRKSLFITALVLVAAVVIAVLLSQGLKGSGATDTKAAGSDPLSIVVPTGGQVPPPPSATATSSATSAATVADLPAIPGEAVPTASAAPESAEGQQQAAAKDVSGFMKLSTAPLEAAVAPNTDELAGVAAGSAYEGVLANAAEFDHNGWHQEGQPVVVFTNVISYDQAQSPDTMTLGVCVDSSKVNVLTESGTVVRAGDAADRSLNILTMTRNDAGNWLVDQVSFPENPNC